ncbi:hypothetical protein [Nocardioides okcheonensis]|uniref:hypothetical protein n=1 Tax=Nocardioides okcheonensis TaxID=2894081 RepID=UPI001E60168A|nr:hypothetical protein [Nocardioides okcheonensis]UFN45351.1 hypothetical protein LN652_03825 [Nocardioides okcheonensis]
MTQHDEPALPEDRFTYEVGAHEKKADDWEAPPVGASIRLMGDHGADMPLWTEELLLADAGEGIRLLGLSQGLASDLEDWGRSWDGRGDHARRDAEAEILLARLRSELGDRYEFRYHR